MLSMDDFLREMDRTHYAFLVIFITIALKSILYAQWQRFKVAQARKPIDLRLRNGVYEEWGIVQRLQRLFRALCWVWLAYMVALIAALIYLKATGQTIYDL